MSDRWEKRKHDKEIDKLIKKAKQDMADWYATLDDFPTEEEVKVWQSGYIYGINRGAGRSENDN
jgi:hypothetical protein